MNHIGRSAIIGAAIAAALPAAQAHAATLVVNVAGSQSVGALGTAGNTVQSYNIGALAHITGVSYSVNITALSPSWLSETTLSFTDSAQLNGVFLNPGFADDNSGTATYTGSANLVDLGLDFLVGADGMLRLEYFESFTDAVTPNARWNSGTVTFTYAPAATAVPEPASWAMMIVGVGMVGGALRRRSKVSTKVAYA